MGTMRAMGRSAGLVRSVQITEGLIIRVPAIAIAGALAWAYVRQASPGLLGEAHRRPRRGHRPDRNCRPDELERAPTETAESVTRSSNCR